VLKKYLESKKNEVIEMMEHEFDYNREIRERVEEAAEEAREEGIKKAIEIYLEMGVEGREAVRLTAAKFNISSEKVKKIIAS
jgi:hypothetical protein